MVVGYMSGAKRAKNVPSLANQTSIFGSMGGIAPTIGVPASVVAVYQRDGAWCNCVPYGVADGYKYMAQRGLIQYNKGAGGIGRSHWSPGIGRLFGGPGRNANSY